MDHVQTVGQLGEEWVVDDQQRGPSVRDPADRLADRVGAVVVEVRGRLIQQKQRAVGQERASERDALGLSGGQSSRAVTDPGVEAAR